MVQQSGQATCNFPPLKRINPIKATPQLGKDGKKDVDDSLEVCREEHSQESVASPMLSITLGDEDTESDESNFVPQTAEVKKQQMKCNAGDDG